LPRRADVPSITLVRLSLCKVERFSQCPPLAYQSFRSFWSFPTNSIAYEIFLCDNL